MIYSQFKYYSSADLLAPRLDGTSGSLISVLDGVLINGYGNKTSAGWLKPIPNDPTYNLACYQQPSGSRMVLHVNDAAPYTASNSNTREAWVTGYENILGLTHSRGYTHGTGQGQFPYTGQQGLGTNLFSGSLVWRKSATTDETERPWMAYVDPYTLYLWVQTGLSANTWDLYMFGDIFSFKQTRDEFKVMMTGRIQANATNDGVTINPSDIIFQMDYATYPHYMARGWGGEGRAIRVVKVGDAGRGAMSNTSYAIMNGVLTAPNPVDGAMYFSPLWVSEVDNTVLRGRMRGLWFPTHPVANFGDGQTITGTGELSGKTFRIIKQGPSAGMWAIETGNTVDTNED